MKHIEQARKLYKEKKLEAAISAYGLALEGEPDHPEYLYERGLTYFHLNKKSLALLDFNRAVEMQPNNPFRYSSRAYIRNANGDLIGALEDYKRAIQLDPEDAIAHNNLGLIEEQLGRQQIAKEHYSIADKLASEKEEWKSLYTAPDTSKSEEIVIEEEEELSFWTIIRRVFTDKTTFIEFLSFLKKGLKK